MNYGFVKTAVVTPKIKVADVAHNGAEIEKYMREAAGFHATLIVFPELCLKGATCGDAFCQDLLLKSAKEELKRLIKVSEEVSGLVFVGLPWEHRGKLYNVAAAFEGGQLLGIVPKTYFKDGRNFTAGKPGYEYIDFEGEMIPFGTSLLFTCENDKNLVVAAACRSLGGKPLPQGDVGYAIEVFDGLLIGLQLWLGDDEFPSQLKLMWDANALQYLRFETMHFAVGLLMRLLKEEIKRI